MPGRMAPLKKPRNTPRLPLALNPLKSKDVLAVLAERNQAVVPIGAWVEPASPDSSEIPAYTSACVIEEELKEQLRKKQEALKHFQNQVKRRVNQHVRLKKKQQLQRSFEAAEKEGSIAMQSSDPAHLTRKRRTSVFPNNLNAAIGSSWLPPSPEDEENQNELFQQQAQALSQTMKQVCHRLASLKTMGKKKASVFPDDERKSVPTQEFLLLGKFAFSALSENLQINLFIFEKWRGNHLSEIKDKPFNRVQKVQFKNPLFDVAEEEELNELHLQDILPEAQDYLPEAQSDLSETQGDLPGIQNVKPDVQAGEPKGQAGETEAQAGEPEAQASETEAQAGETKTQGVMFKAQSIERENESIVLEAHDFLPQNQDFLPKDQNFLSKDQDALLRDQDVLPKNQSILPKDQDILPKCQDQDFPPKDQVNQPSTRNQLDQEEERDEQGLCQTIDRREREVFPLDVHQDLLHKCQDQATIRTDKKYSFLFYFIMFDIILRFKKVRFREPYSDTTEEREREDFALNVFPKQPSSFLREEKVRQELPQENHQCVVPKIQDKTSSREQQPQQSSFGTAEREQEDLLLDGHHHLPPRHHKEASSRRQKVYDTDQSGLNTDFQALLALQSGLDQEENKKVRQKQYLRYKRLFMDIEREQVKEQQRQKERKKKIEKIKKKKEQESYAEEQRIPRVTRPEEPYSGENMSEILAQLQLSEFSHNFLKRELAVSPHTFLQYVEVLRAQIQEKMQRHNITLPPLCCCGPDFWDAHPDTCANSCIFYKNHRAYTQALQSVIGSCDTPEGNSTLRIAICNFASSHRRTLKNLLH
uniref:Coiled-coil domain containing 15 n=1 Tax=Loxodonta africana TaxID=9785 RepID=G3TYA2_LOXAF